MWLGGLALAREAFSLGPVSRRWPCRKSRSLMDKSCRVALTLSPQSYGSEGHLLLRNPYVSVPYHKRRPSGSVEQVSGRGNDFHLTFPRELREKAAIDFHTRCGKGHKHSSEPTHLPTQRTPQFPSVQAKRTAVEVASGAREASVCHQRTSLLNTNVSFPNQKKERKKIPRMNPLHQKLLTFDNLGRMLFCVQPPAKHEQNLTAS